MNDTIVAISTAVANNAISIIRLSGSDAIEITNKFFKGKDLKTCNSHTIHYGHIIDNDLIVDEVLVSIFLEPKTFTKENIVEINCHGGVYVTNKILEIAIANGARLAEAGEFTKRAFLNGRIDLTQAEAIMDMIEADTKQTLQMAALGLNGEVKKIINNFRNKLLSCIAQVEVNIDYPEYESESEITNGLLKPIINELLLELKNILKKAETSVILKNGITTAIIGKPNVGKSSLLNTLIMEEKAIVTNVAGTTRDIVEGKINIGGIILNLIDTAGIRETDNIIERIGIEKTKTVIENSSLILLLFDYHTPLEKEDLQLLEVTKDKPRIIIVNKQDLDQKIDLNILEDHILISSLNKTNIDLLKKKILEVCKVGNLNNIDASYIGNARQLGKLRNAYDNLSDAMLAINSDLPVDIINIDIHNAWMNLGEIVGDVTNEDLINELFSKFCLGK